MKMVIKHSCGHRAVHEVGDGPADQKSARAFEQAMRDCKKCEDANKCDGDAE